MGLSYFVVPICMVLLACGCHAEVFTAMADMEALLYAEKNVVHVIDDYIKAEQTRLQRLKDFALEYQSRNSEAIQHGTDFIANPVNSYLVIKRLTSDWGYVESLMRSNSAEEFIRNISSSRSHNNIKFPGSEDLSGAAAALLRLQDTYKLDTADVASGNIQGVKKANQLSAHDCFELGRVAYNENDFYHTLLWMQEALNRLDTEEPATANMAEILEYLAYAMYQQGNVKHALELTKRLYELEPEHPRAFGNVKYYEDQLKREIDERGDEALPPLEFVNNPRYDDGGVAQRDVYESLCRGEIQPTPKVEKTLYCYYKNDVPFLRISPLKAEIVYWRPMVIIFRKVVYDSEIEVIKELALPRLQRATVQNAQTGNLEPASYRISKSAWLKDEDHPAIAKVSKRLDHMTNLNMKTAEDLQVANYGIGGHYEPHYDFAQKEEKNAFKGLNTGNRVATVLFYLSQPEAGGATVFPELRLSLFPSMYDAAFWFNLLKSGEGDMTTRHAACPVLSGVKWVSNKWIHEYGQEFRRPCGLDEYEYM